MRPPSRGRRYRPRSFRFSRAFRAAPAHRAVVEHDPGYDRILEFRSVAATAGTVRALGYQAAVVTWATLPTALVPFLAGIPRRVGQARRLYSSAFTDRVVVRSERGDHRSHWTDILLDYARALGCDDLAAQPAFVPTAVDAALAAALRQAAGVTGPFALLHPTRGLSAHREGWPIDGFVELARALQGRDGIPLIVTGSAGDAAVAERIAAAAGLVSLAGRTPLGAFGALAHDARYVVAMDSGPMHVAAAVGAPTVGVFSMQSDEPDRWAPRGPHVAVVRATYPCPPGHRKETCPDFACVRALDVGGVLRALDGLAGSIAERPR
jgi:ADP-heptose:LPS heptosyltransferase